MKIANKVNEPTEGYGFLSFVGGCASRPRKSLDHQINRLWRIHGLVFLTCFILQLLVWYKDGDDEWQSTDSFGRDDLLVAAKALSEAHSWIFSQGREDQEEAK